MPADPTVIESALEKMSWAMYKPVSTATRMVPNPESTSMFNQTIYKPFSEEELAASLFEGSISIGLSPDFRFPDWKFTHNTPPGGTTTFGGLLTAIDKALDTPADEEMKQELRDLGGMAAMKRDFQNRTTMTDPSPPGRVPTCFETWDGDEGSITARHCIGNHLYAYFEGVGYDPEIDVFRIRIGT